MGVLVSGLAEKKNLDFKLTPEINSDIVFSPAGQNKYMNTVLHRFFTEVDMICHVYLKHIIY